MDPKFTLTEVKLLDAWNAAEGSFRDPGEGEIGFLFRWKTADVGFGETTFYMGKGGMRCDNEGMTREFVGCVLAKFLEGVEMDDVGELEAPQ